PACCGPRLCSPGRARWGRWGTGALREESAAWRPVPQATAAHGPAVIESWTVGYPRSGPPAGVVAGRLADGGGRFLARAADGDTALLGLLSSADPAGQQILARSADGVNYVTLARG